MTGIKVTAAQLMSIGDRLNAGSETVDEELGQLRAAMQPLFDGDWQGVASAGFQQLWDEWQQAGATLKQALEGLSLMLKDAGLAYQDTEDRLAQSFNQR